MKREEKKGAFTQHAMVEEEFREDAGKLKQSTAMTIISRVVLFFLFPTIIGVGGVVTSYFQNKYSTDGDREKPIDFDRDFVFPFLMSMVVVVVIGVQTHGFKSYQTAPLVQWPKVVKKKKVVRKRVILDDDGNEVSEADVLEKIKQKKKSLKED